MSNPPIKEAFYEIVMLAERMGVEDINELPGCWECQIDERWWIAVNGHREPAKCSAGPEVPPFTAYVQFNGWPAGIIDPYGGIIAAGDAANEDAFITALKGAGRDG
jgi:hypothetical protein